MPDYTSIEAASTQLAFQAILEGLGSLEGNVHVIMPVTSPAYVLAATLRAGAKPLPVDIDPITLQVDLEALKALMEYEDVRDNSVLIINSCLEDVALFTYIEEQSIVTIRDCPEGYTEQTYTPPYDVITRLRVIEGQTGLIEAEIRVQEPFPSESVQASLTGPLGLAGGAALSLADFKPTLNHAAIHILAAKYNVDLAFITDYAVIRHAEARRIRVLLQDLYQESALYFLPLHFIPVVKSRWQDQEALSYPAAEAMYTNYLAIQEDELEHIEFIFKTISEMK